MDNLPRVLKDGMMAKIDASAWQAPPVFRWIYEAAKMTPEQLLRTFNCGIGMVAIVAEADVSTVAKALEADGESVYRLGTLVQGDGPPCVEITGV